MYLKRNKKKIIVFFGGSFAFVFFLFYFFILRYIHVSLNFNKQDKIKIIRQLI